jgi:hypothetical protein
MLARAKKGCQVHALGIQAMISDYKAYIHVLNLRNRLTEEVYTSRLHAFQGY